MVQVSNIMITVAAASIIIIASIGSAILVSCADDNNVDEVSVIDMRGREVTVPSDVHKVACVGAGALRLVSYFGIDKVAGVDGMDALMSGSPDNYELASYRVAYDIKSKVDAHSLKSIYSLDSQEEVILSGVQVVFTTDENINILNMVQANTGIPIVGLRAEVGFDLDMTEDFSRQIRLVGKVLGEKDRAEELINHIQNLRVELENLKGKANTDDFKESYVGGIMTFMDGSFYKTTGKYLPFTWSVGKNVMPDRSGKPYMTGAEEILISKPEIIFVDIASYDMCINELKNNYYLFEDTPAVKNKKIFTLLPYKYYNTNYDCELINCFAIGHIIAPKVYDFNISEKADEIFKMFFPETKMTYEDYTKMIGHRIAPIPANEYMS